MKCLITGICFEFHHIMIRSNFAGTTDGVRVYLIDKGFYEYTLGHRNALMLFLSDIK